MDLGRWDPRCERPSDLVPPRPIDEAGRQGPTRAMAYGPSFRRTSPGLFVPVSVRDDVVEQRILEQGSRLRTFGAVSGWAALRWQGARFFTGDDWVGGARLDVPLIVGPGRLRRRDGAGFTLTQEQLAPNEWHVLDGLCCTVPARALFDEVRRAAGGGLREAVVAADMAVAALPLSAAEFRTYVGARGPWTAVGRAREVGDLVSDGSRSPQESRLRLVWVVDAGLPPPLCNVPVFDRRGRLLGVPDLFEPVAGVGAEYDGADHRRLDRHRRDVRRDADFRDHGIELVHVVEGELSSRHEIADRLNRAYERAQFLEPSVRAWTLEPSPRAA